MPNDPPQPKAAVSISYGTIAAGATVVAIAAVTGLVILAAVKDVDTLSAIALALAIVAFMVQIVVFIAQTWSTNHLNAETRSFLTELRTRSKGTEELLGKQVDKLTDDLISRAAEVAKGGHGSVRARQELRQDVERALQAASSGPSSEPGSDAWERTPFNVKNLEPAEVERTARLLTSFPEEGAAEPLVAKMRSLSPSALEAFVRYARDARECFASPGLRAVPGFPEDVPYAAPIEELVTAGLLKNQSEDARWMKLSAERPNSNWMALTDDGLELARLFVADGPIPDYLTSNRS